MTKATKQNLSLTAIAAFLLLVHFYFFHSGYFGYDELEYTHLAAKLLRGDFEHGLNLYAYRWAIIFPLTLFYALFGIGDFANMLPTLSALLIIVFGSLHLMKAGSLSSKTIAVFFLVCTPIHLMYLAKPMPDVLVELGFLLCFVAYFKVSFSPLKSSTFPVVLFVFGAILVFLSKESFLIFYPFFLVLLIADLWKKKRWTFWRSVILSGFAFLLFYFTYFWITTGNPIIRVEALFHERFISECTYDLQPSEVLFRRIAYGLWLSFMKFGVLIPIGFIVLLSKRYSLSQGEKFTLLSYLGLLLLSNFMTISYTSYVPLCDDTRHFLFIFPIAALVAIIGFSHLNRMGLKHRIFIALTLIIQWYLCAQTSSESYFFIFIPISLGILFWGRLNTRWLWTVIILVGLFYQYYSNARYNRSLNFPKQQALIEFVMERKAPVVVVTDPANARIGRLYAKYQAEKYQFLDFQEYRKTTPPPDSLYFISNGITSYHSSINWDQVPQEIIDAPQNLKPVMKNSAGEVYLLHN